MKTQLIMSGLVATLLSTMPVLAFAQTQITLKVAVVGTSCDMQIVGGMPSLDIGQFTSDDFTGNWVTLPGNRSFTVTFPGGSCLRDVAGEGGHLALRVSGPSARGSEEEIWGDHYTDLAYGIRLKYEQAGISGSHPLTPKNNMLLLRYAFHHRGPATIPDVIFRPEIKTWDYRQVRNGSVLAVPLVFSLAYL